MQYTATDFCVCIRVLLRRGCFLRVCMCVCVCEGREVAGTGEEAAAAAGRLGRPPQGLHVSGSNLETQDKTFLLQC